MSEGSPARTASNCGGGVLARSWLTSKWASWWYTATFARQATYIATPASSAFQSTDRYRGPRVRKGNRSASTNNSSTAAHHATKNRLFDPQVSQYPDTPSTPKTTAISTSAAVRLIQAEMRNTFGSCSVQRHARARTLRKSDSSIDVR